MANHELTEDAHNVEWSLATGFYSWNVQANSVHGDEVIANIFGVSAQDLALGMPIQVVIQHIDDGDKQRVAKAIHQAILSGMPYKSEYRLTHPDGRKVHVSAIGRCLRDSQGVPSIYTGTVTILDNGLFTADQDLLEQHCKVALDLAHSRGKPLAARYIASALNVLGVTVS